MDQISDSNPKMKRYDIPWQCSLEPGRRGNNSEYGKKVEGSGGRQHWPNTIKLHLQSTRSLLRCLFSLAMLVTLCIYSSHIWSLGTIYFFFFVLIFAFPCKPRYLWRTRSKISACWNQLKFCHRLQWRQVWLHRYSAFSICHSLFSCRKVLRHPWNRNCTQVIKQSGSLINSKMSLRKFQPREVLIQQLQEEKLLKHQLLFRHD